MYLRTTIPVAAVLVFTAIGTLYIYWTRTPQYVLLHVLEAHAKADGKEVSRYIETEKPLNNKLIVKGRTEDVIQHLAAFQNKTLARTYGVTVEESRMDGKTAKLRVKVGETTYQLRFDEEIDGRWKLIDFEARQVFSEQAIKRMKPNHFIIFAGL
jgi:hypothetical protein